MTSTLYIGGTCVSRNGRQVYLGYRNDMYGKPILYSNTTKYPNTLLTDCTPYLLQLGLSKAHTSLVWIAGPLSGLIMQPVVGVLADRSRSKWGRRRPFMIGGTIIVGFGLLVLGWTGEIVGIFVEDTDLVSRQVRCRGCNGTDSLQKRKCTIVLAVVGIYAVDFAINAGECVA